MNQRKREGDEERSQEYALNDFDGFVHRSGVWKCVAWKRKSAALYLFLPVCIIYSIWSSSADRSLPTIRRISRKVQFASAIHFFPVA